MKTLALFVPIVAILATACADKPPPKAPAEPVVTTRTTSATVQDEPKPVSPNLAVSDEIARACQLTIGNVDVAPKFDFDKSDLLPADRDVLAQIAKCVTTGPLAGRKLQLVGRADPRGTVEYNMALGGRRAYAAAVELARLGVSEGNLRQTSRGELDAKGTDERGWLVDRRVDVLLLP